MFDPYHKWLGIPAKDQPPNHYRLLGLQLFESDVEVIEAAANRQMAYVQQRAIGEHAAVSQKLLNELSAARVCLLNPKKKAGYDANLKTQQVEREPPAAVLTSHTPSQPVFARPADTSGSLQPPSTKGSGTAFHPKIARPKTPAPMSSLAEALPPLSAPISPLDDLPNEAMPLDGNSAAVQLPEKGVKPATTLGNNFRRWMEAWNIKRLRSSATRFRTRYMGIVLVGLLLVLGVRAAYLRPVILGWISGKPSIERETTASQHSSRAELSPTPEAIKEEIPVGRHGAGRNGLNAAGLGNSGISPKGKHSRLRRLDEIADSIPNLLSVTGDGAEIVWDALASRMSIGRKESSLGTFTDQRLLVPGVVPAISSDGMEIIFVAAGIEHSRGRGLFQMSMSDRESSFNTPSEIAELADYDVLTSPCLSEDGLSLCLVFFPRDNFKFQKRRIAVMKRQAKNDPWTEQVLVELPEGLKHLVQMAIVNGRDGFICVGYVLPENTDSHEDRYGQMSHDHGVGSEFTAFSVDVRASRLVYRGNIRWNDEPKERRLLAYSKSTKDVFFLENVKADGNRKRSVWVWQFDGPLEDMLVR